VFVIPGNDDPKSEDGAFRAGETAGVWEFLDGRVTDLGGHRVFGYPYVPPTPFQLKDWERYDVSRYTDPGCVSPEEGARTAAVRPGEIRHATIAGDLATLTGDEDLSKALFLFHSPPYRTHLDRAALDGKMIDHVPLDVHVGSIAVKRLIENRQPLITMHGHVHESARITGEWRDRIGETHLFGAAHHGPELALVRFDPADPDAATRELLG
jgi:Icc-related predicted phosphoesterase